MVWEFESKQLWFGNWKVMIPEWYLSVNYLNLCQQCNKLMPKQQFHFYCVVCYIDPKHYSQLSITEQMYIHI